MNIWAKRILVAVLVLLVGIAIFIATFNANKYKGQIEQLVSKNYGLNLAIEGDISLSVFPNIALVANQLSLSDGSGNAAPLELDQLRLGVELSPLLSAKAVVNNFELDGLNINLVKDANGKFNIQKLIETAANNQSESTSSGAVEASGKPHTSIEETGYLYFAKPLNFSVKGRLLANAPQLDINFNLQSKLHAELATQQYQIDSLSVELQGSANLDQGATVVDGLKLDMAVQPVAFNLSSEWSEAALNSLVNSITANGSLTTNSLVTNGFKLSDLSSNVLVQEGGLSLKGLSAALYDGKLQGNIATSLNQKTSIDAVITGVNVSKITQDLANEERMSGTANIKAVLSTQGFDAESILKSVSGAVNAEIENGSLRGIDLEQTMDEVRDTIKSIRALKIPVLSKVYNPGHSTSFTAMQSSSQIKNGVINLDKLLVSSGRLKVTNSNPAIIDLVNSRFNLVVNVRKQAESGSNEVDLSRLQGIDVPVSIKGSFSKPSYSVELKGLIGSITTNPDTLKNIGKSLKGLFR